MRAASFSARMRPGGILLLLMLGQAPLAAALDSQRVPTQYAIKTWQTDDGLPYSAVSAMLQTKDYYLWLGTNAGLARFDGVRFVDAGAGLIEGGVVALAETSDGTLWIATQSGRLAQRKDGHLTVRDGPGQGFAIAALLPARDGALWIATLGAGVYRLAGGRYEHQRPLGFTEILTMTEDREGVLWMGGRGTGLLKLFDGRWTRYGTRDGLPNNTVTALYEDRTGSLWIGTSGGLACLRHGRITAYRHTDRAAPDSVTALSGDAEGNLWIGTQAGGLRRFANGRFAALAQREGLADDSVRVLLQDHERSLWVGTSNGLTRLSDGGFTTYGRFEGLRDPAVHTLAEGSSGDVWIGTGAGGAFLLRDGRVTPLGVLANANVMAIHLAHEGSLWLATGDSRLFRVKGSLVTEETPRGRGNVIPKITCITEYGGDVLFAGSGLGLGRIVDRRFILLHRQAPPIPFIFAIHVDQRGTLWLGTSQGLVRVKNGQYAFFTTRDGLPDDRVRSIAGERDGTLWLATMGGLCRFRDGAIRCVTMRNGLPDALLRLVLDDGHGSLWLSSVGHIFRLSKPQVAGFLDGTIARVTPYEFDTADGLRTTEVPVSAYAGFRAHDGRLWFATARGASVIAPAEPETSFAPPPLRIERVVVDGVENARGIYPPGKGTVDIHYAALSYRAPERLRFRHRLRGLDETWMDAGDRRSAHYTNLRPRRYTFLVDVADRDGIWSEKPAMLTFTIRPNWYQTGVVFWLGVALVAAIVWVAYRVRMFEMRQRYSAVLKERNRLAREMHDTLAQNLGGVAFQLDAVKMQYRDIPAELMQKLDETSKMIRYSVAEAYRGIRDLRAQALETRDLAAAISEAAQRATADTNLEVRVSVDGPTQRLNAIAENNLLRIVQEAITNAVSHSGAQHLEVALQFSKDRLSVRVHDDGCGFDTEQALAPGAGHYGLLGMRERVNRIGARMTLTSTSGGGSEVLVELPLKASFWKEWSGA